MEAHARAPEPLTSDGDMANNWQRWKEDFIIFMKITGYIQQPNEIRANFLKNRIGKVGIDAIQSISFDEPEDKDDMDKLIVKLDEYFNPPKKEVVERYYFFTRSKKQTETIEQYINILKENAKTCNFNDMTESIIRDKIILDTHDKILRKQFFEAENLDLQKLVKIYNDYNVSIEKMKQVTKDVTEENNFVQKPQCVNTVNRPPCWRCDHHHPQGKCPAWGSKCTKCGDINHFTHCCKGFKPKGNNYNKVNKNILNPVQQPKLTPKSSLPDIPIVSNEDVGSPTTQLGKDITSDFVMLNAHTSHSNLNYKNTIKQSAHSHKSSAYPTNMEEQTKLKKITSNKPMYTSVNRNTSQVDNSTLKNVSAHNNVKHLGTRTDENNCTLC